MISPKITNLGYSNLWTDMSTILGYASTFDQQIQKLFANNEQGFAYDPNDLSTMFQDAAGTIPVTAAGQPVGLVLDKSKSLLKIPVVIPDTNTWITSSMVVSNVDGVVTLSGAGGIALSGGFPVGGFIRVRVVYSKTGGEGSFFGLYDAKNVNTNLHVATATASAGELIAVYKNTTSGFYLRLNTAGSFTVNSVQVDVIEGNHAYQDTSASRPILRQNAVTGANYLEFDGSDDFLQTSNIDFTGTDKVSLFAGVRKNSGSVRVLCELSSDMNANDGSFYLTAPENSQGRYGFKARANAIQNPSMTALTQNTSIDDICVLSASGDLSADRNTIRRNGVFSSINYELGSGNFGNYPLFIGRRAGASLPFNGHLYNLIGIGKLVSDTETAVIEKELAKRVGVSLNV